MQKTPLVLGLLAAVSFILPCGAQSASNDGQEVDVDMMAREYRDANNGPGALTKTMIKDCIILKTNMDKRNTKLDNLRKKVSKLNNEVRELGASLKNNRGKFHKGEKSKERTQYKAKIKEYNSKIPHLKKLTKSYQDMADPYKQKNIQFEEECNGQPYYEDDYREIAKEMGRGM